MANQSLSQINTTICAVSGLDVHNDTSGSSANQCTTPSPRKMKPKCESDESWRKPVRVLESLIPKEVKRLTGFNDLKMLLSFSTVVCDGELTTMTRTSSVLTWLEEWILYFEFIWGHSLNRYVDFETIYNCREKQYARSFGQR